MPFRNEVDEKYFAIRKEMMPKTVELEALDARVYERVKKSGYRLV